MEHRKVLTINYTFNLAFAVDKDGKHHDHFNEGYNYVLYLRETNPNIPIRILSNGRSFFSK